MLIVYTWTYDLIYAKTTGIKRTLIADGRFSGDLQDERLWEGDDER